MSNRRRALPKTYIVWREDSSGHVRCDWAVLNKAVFGIVFPGFSSALTYRFKVVHRLAVSTVSKAIRPAVASIIALIRISPISSGPIVSCGVWATPCILLLAMEAPCIFQLLLLCTLVRLGCTCHIARTVEHLLLPLAGHG